MRPMTAEPALRNGTGQFVATEDVAERDALILRLLASGHSYQQAQRSPVRVHVTTRHPGRVLANERGLRHLRRPEGNSQQAGGNHPRPQSLLIRLLDLRERHRPRPVLRHGLVSCRLLRASTASISTATAAGTRIRSSSTSHPSPWNFTQPPPASPRCSTISLRVLLWQ